MKLVTMINQLLKLIISNQLNPCQSERQRITNKTLAPNSLCYLLACAKLVVT